MHSYNKKPMSESEKKAKLSALKEANSMASGLMKDSLSRVKDPNYLKKHVKDMSQDSGIDFKGDSDHITDPELEGDVIGRHISDENDVVETTQDLSSYDIDAQIEKLMAHKAKFKKG